jgi:hypothetical protein
MRLLPFVAVARQSEAENEERKEGRYESALDMEEVQGLFQELWFSKCFDLADERQVVLGIPPK